MVTVGIDVAQHVCQMHGVDARGKVVVNKRLTRAEVERVMAKRTPCLVGMAVRGGANSWRRKFQSFGHHVRLMSPQFAMPSVKSNKHDGHDAEAMCEAVSRPPRRVVTPKRIAQQDLQRRPRIRHRLIQTRTALTTQLRGLLGA